MNFTQQLVIRFLLFFTPFIPFAAFAQTGSVSGKVTDDKNEPLTGAIAELRNADDSSLAKVNAPVKRQI